MGTEIERKYLVNKSEWRSYKNRLQSKSVVGARYCQGYIPTSNGTTVRIRIVEEQGFITIKSKTVGYTRAEFEYPIPLDDALAMLDNLCLKPVIDKYRYKVQIDNSIWEVDEFLGENEGLIIAEVELESEEQQVNLPPWIDREVNDRKYFNSYLVKHPYSTWDKRSR